MHLKQIHSSALLISGGIILMILGVVGSLLLNNFPPNSITKGRFRFAEKATEIPLFINEINSPETNLILLPTINPENHNSPGELIPTIVPFRTLIHTSNNNMESPKIPDLIEIPSINLIAPVVVSDFNLTKVEGETFGQWVAPSKFAAGWHPDAALLGKIGNTVINGHHNEFGEVFAHLVDVKVGDIIVVSSGNDVYKFVVANRLILAERFQPAEVRLENARWLSKTDDIRLTLVTCWPKDSNTHRLIIVARPLSSN